MCKFLILKDQDKYHMTSILLILKTIPQLQELIHVLVSFMVLFQFALSSKVDMNQENERYHKPRNRYKRNQ